MEQTVEVVRNSKGIAVGDKVRVTPIGCSFTTIGTVTQLAQRPDTCDLIYVELPASAVEYERISTQEYADICARGAKLALVPAAEPAA